MSDRHKTEGLPWKSATIGNAKWSGTLLRHLLERMGVSLVEMRDLHVEFLSSQRVEEDKYYASSIPLEEALNEKLPVLLATRMNDEPLTQAHGGPVRTLIPGYIGARSVKWLTEVRLRNNPSSNFYFQKDYKVLPEDTTPDTKAEAMRKTEPLQRFSLTSSIIQPEASSTLPSRKFIARGYAASGKSPVAKVEVAIIPLASAGEDISLYADRYGQWQEAEVEGSDHPFAWSLWHIELTIPVEVKAGAKIALVCRAESEDGAQQTMHSQWNLRGVDETSWPVVMDLTVPEN